MRVFVLNISSPPLKWRYKRYGLWHFFVIHVGGGTACVQQKFESVYGLVICMNWDFVVLSLIYFHTASILFDLKNLSLSKHFERLTGRIHCLPVIHLI